MTSVDSLLKELEEIKNRTELPLERRLIDTAVWFHSNKGRLPRDDLVKRLEFMEKTMDIQLELLAMIVQRLQEAEHRGSSLWLPNGISVRGDLGKFG